MANKKTIPTVYEGQPQPLQTLDASGKKMWAHLMEVLPKKVLCAADSSTLTMLCKLWSHYVLAEKEYLKILKSKSAEPGERVDWKSYSAMSGAIAKFNELSKRFGLTPLDRTKIVPKGTGKEKGKDPLDSILGDLNKKFAERN